MLSPVVQQCHKCHHDNSRPVDIPDGVWPSLIMTGARLTEEQRKTIHRWDSSSRLSSARLSQLLGQLDQYYALLGQQSGAKPNFMTETQARSGSAGAGDVIRADNDQIRAKCISLTASLYEADDAIQGDTDDNEDEDIQSTDSDMDMQMFDDDGGELVDRSGRDLVPFLSLIHI